jgi:hypothetical protein
MNTMARVIPFRRRSGLPIALGAAAIAVFAFVATTMFLNWQSRPVANQATSVEIIPPDPIQSGPIEVIDGDTVRFRGTVYPPALLTVAGSDRPGAASGTGHLLEI